MLLLVNPAHQTALNARKRLVLLGTHPASHELCFVDALLTLRDGAKQSILWHHRRWLLRHIHPPLPAPSPPPSSSSCAGDPGHGDGVDTIHGLALSPDAFRAEIAAVERACEAYPRNYHAWAHRFLCAEALALSVSCPPLPPSPSAAASSQSQGRAEALRELEAERARVRAWVERHVADYSAMQYACRLELLFRDHLELVEADNEKRVGAGAGAHALELARAYPSHEALWLYLRGAVALDLFPSSSGTREGDARAAIDGLAERYLDYPARPEGAIAASGARSEARGHAVRFVAWRKWMVSLSPRL